MVFGLWLEVVDVAKALIPFRNSLKKRQFTFISIHFVYMISMVMGGSLLILAAGGLKYIDALFFASGAATQSGLNTVDVNKLHTYQQVVMYCMAMVCNPIAINTFVVFVRLYWFERRFQHIVKEARTLRRTKSRPRTNTQALESVETKERKPVNGRDIRIIRHTDMDGAADAPGVERKDLEAVAESVESQSGESSDAGKAEHRNLPKLNTSDLAQVRSPESASIRLPEQLDAERHIAFLENQRNPKDKSTLRIPSPREFDRGGVPEAIDDDSEDNTLARHTTSPAENTAPGDDGVDNHPPIRHHITIDEPAIHPTRSKTATFPRPQPRRTPTDPEPSSNAFMRARTRTGTFSSILRPAASFMRAQTHEERDPMPYLSWQPTIGRNSAFVDLTEEQREELGGIEYRALKTLAIVLVGYYVSFHLLGVIIFVPWILRTQRFGRVVQDYGQGRVWWAIFTAQSGFNDLGFTLTPDSMASFSDAVLILIIMTFLIVIGNTGFPCMLRFVIWILSKVVPYGSGLWEELRFLLDHPRRCFTLLFPSRATWWLFWILVLLNGVDLIFFVILDLNDPTVEQIPGGLRFLNGLFQASCTRTAGFSVVSLADLHPAIQVSYLIMMYISVFPIAISLRRTNVYEEKSLGIYPAEEEDPNNKEPSYVGAHLRKQLGFDLWYVFLGLFVIAIIEGGRIESTNEYAFTMFSVLFEIISAYGTVGLSLGYPGSNTSFSGQFQTLSKLVIIAMQIRGRHRGLPYDLDRAILLPSESLQRKETEDAERRLRRRNSNISAVSGATMGRFASGADLGTLASGRENDGGDGSDGQQPHQVTSREHNSHLRQGLGSMMARLAEHPSEKEEKDSGKDK